MILKSCARFGRVTDPSDKVICNSGFESAVTTLMQCFLTLDGIAGRLVAEGSSPVNKEMLLLTDWIFCTHAQCIII